MQYRRFRGIAPSVCVGGLVLLMSACNGSQESSSQALRNDNPITLTGSIGDGPVAEAQVSVLDSQGQLVVAGVSDSAAGYQITVPAGTAFPVTVTASGGTDLVSGLPPDFSFKAVLLDPTVDRVNVSPFSSLALAVTNCGGKLTSKTLTNAWTLLEDHLGMGLDAARVPDPTHGVIDAGNVADIVLANEALGEVFRRTEAALAGTSAAADAATLIDRLGCDLVDGAIDGVGASADRRTSATFAAASAGVMLEVIAGKLQVNGSDAMAAMDQAIQTVLPGANVSTLSVPVSGGLVNQARDALALMMTTLPDGALGKYAALLGSTSPDAVRAAVNGAMSNADLVTLDGLASRVAASDDTQIEAINDASTQQTAALAPIVSFAAAPDTVAAGGTAMLSWSASDALSCQASGAWSGTQATDGTFTTGPLQAAQTYGLACVGLGGATSAQASVQIAGSTPSAPPVTTLTAAPATINSGGSSVLSWSASNADSCVASGGWSGNKSASGTQSVGPLTANSSYSIACTGAGGTSSASTTVLVQQAGAAAPTLSFSASPLSVPSGGASTLTWSSANATSCVASGAWTGNKSVSGTASTGALTANATYTLACTGAGGTVTQTASVTIAAADAPTLTFTASPTSVQSGGASQLTWSTTNATSCTASGSWSGSRSTSGTQSTGALTGNGNYSLRCTGSGGSVSQSVSVTLLAAPTLTLSASPTSVQAGGTSQLTWAATNATSCTASGGWSGTKATSGTQSTGTLSAGAVYSLTCTGSGGTVAQTTAVTVAAAVPTLTLSASPTSLQSGSASQLTWSATNATSCSASGSWTGTKATSGTQSTGALSGNGTYTLTCAGAGGSVSQTATVSVLPAPTLTFGASPLSVPSGGSSTLTWTSTNASSCVAGGGWTGSKNASGSASTGALTADTTYTLACTGAGGTVTRTAAVSIAAASAPTLTFNAAPTSVQSGSASQLSWSTTNATSCSATGSWTGTKGTSGTQSTGALTADGAYSLSCTGTGGSVAQTVSVAVLPAPTLTLAASPTSVPSGSASQLTWNASNATSCTASGSWSGTKATSGSQSTGALTANGTYTLTCSGGGGTVAQTASVAVLPAPALTLTASPASVQSGGASQLTWSATNATSCAASGSWSGSKATSGTQATGALTGNSSYTLTCTGAGGSASQTATVAVAPAPTLTLTASPTNVASGSASQLSWSTTNATSCAASGSWTGTKATSGTQSTGALTGAGTYTLTCSGAGGSVAQTTSVAVLPAPTLTLSASPTSVQSGSASQLSWSATNATTCTASGSWSGAKGMSGSQSTGTLTANASYTLTCTGSGGSVAQTTAVTVAAAAPTLTLSASPTSVASGSTSQLTWNASNATSCTASGSWSGTKAASGTQSTGALTANASYTLTCTGSGGSTAQTAAVTVTTPAPTLTLSALPTSVQSGASSQLTWSTTNATSCTASGAWSGAKGTSGTQSTGALSANSNFTLACAGAGGNVSKAVSVTVTAGTPTVNLSANPPGVARNGTSTLTWAGTNVTGCTASGGWSGSLATSGSQSVGPITQDTSYSLNCSGSGGSAVAMTTVSLREAKLTWQAPTKNVDGSTLTTLSGYKIYYGTTSKNYTQSVSVSGASTTQWTLSLAPGTYYFAIAATSADGESAKTNEVSKTVN